MTTCASLNDTYHPSRFLKVHLVNGNILMQVLRRNTLAYHKEPETKIQY